MLSLGIYGKGSYFRMSAVKKHFKKIISKNMFYHIKGIKLNNKINEIKNLSKLVTFII